MPEYQKCPVCNRTGLISCPPYVAGDQPFWIGTCSGPWTCQCCDGAKVILKPKEGLVSFAREKGDCPHGRDELHWFCWEDSPGVTRNVWNPFSPYCRECGITIGEIINAHSAHSKSVAETVEKANLDRDRLWCTAITQTLLDTRQIEALTKCFNELRDEKPKAIAIKGRK
jgi:hypothetical protein